MKYLLTGLCTVAMSHLPSSKRGFSLVELVTVIALLGILAAVAVPRFSGTDAYEERAATDRLISALRYAQQQAMSRLALVAVCDADDGVALAFSEDGGSTWEALNPPTGSTDSAPCLSGPPPPTNNVWNLATDVTFPQDPVYLGTKGLRVQSNGDLFGDYQNGNRDLTFTISGQEVCLYGLTGFAAKGSC